MLPHSTHRTLPASCSFSVTKSENRRLYIQVRGERRIGYVRGTPPDSSTFMDEAEHINSFVALPGGHHNLGASRNWHFLIVPVWILNGLSYVILLGVTGQWRRLLPTSWTIIPQAWESLLTFARFQIPPD